MSSKRTEHSGAPSTEVGQSHSQGTMQIFSTNNPVLALTKIYVPFSSPSFGNAISQRPPIQYLRIRCFTYPLYPINNKFNPDYSGCSRFP